MDFYIEVAAESKWFERIGFCRTETWFGIISGLSLGVFSIKMAFVMFEWKFLVYNV